MAGTKVQLYDYNNQPIEPIINLNLENYVTDASLKENYYNRSEINNIISDNNNYVTIDDDQTINSLKTFNNGIKIGNNFSLSNDNIYITTLSQKFQKNDVNITLNSSDNNIGLNGKVICKEDITADAFYESSDERLKTFKDNIYIDLDKLQSIKKSYFSFNRTLNKNEIGISAQEIQKYYPEIVSEDNNGYLSVDYCKLSVIALAAIDKLYDRIKYLEYKINNLN